MSPGPELRKVEVADVDAFFLHQLDPEAQRRAAFVPPEPADRVAFLERWVGILTHPRVVARTIVVEGQVVGHVVAYPEGAQLQVGYWIARKFWSRGIATAALAAFLEEVPERPLWAHAAEQNPASGRVLEKNGFRLQHTQSAYSTVLAQHVTEQVWLLDC